ncbi:hypothetical protein L0F63_006763, partial [Massospora cicadina]
MLANKPLSPCILPTSSVIESLMGGDNSLSVEAPLSLMENGDCAKDKSSIGCDSVSSTATDFPALGEAQILTKPTSIQPNLASDARDGSKNAAELPACGAIEQENGLAVGENGGFEDDIPSSPYSADLSDAVEMELDKVAHIADCYANESHPSATKPTSKPTNPEHRQKQKPKPKSKLSSSKKAKERDDPKYLYLKSSMNPLTHSEREPDFDTLLESTVLSQTGSENLPTRRDPGVNRKASFVQGQNGGFHDGPQPLRDITQASYLHHRSSDRDARSNGSLTGKELRRPARPGAQKSHPNPSRSPPRPSQHSNGSRFLTRKSHPPENPKDPDHQN